MPDGVCDAFIARPAGGGKYPAVLLFMDAYGPRDWLYAMARKIAAGGYYVLLPNLFYRTRRAPVVGLSFPLRPEQMQDAVQNHIMPLFRNYSPAFGVRDAGVFLDFLAGQKEADAAKAGITGYCMGGGLALRVAARYPDRIAAAASFHGGNLATQEPESPHRQLGNVRAELYIAHADHDKSMPPEQIELLHDALEQAGIKYAAEIYKDAAHGFTMADLPAYDAAALERHWEHVFSLFGRALKGAKA
ncbi:MAG: dienelactone hydrolase family protein [Alphaproteobacteria bacterium]|nr:dienelactone hydrolase family protein [Alphaproteobacteria bacterium]MDE2337004.1 dienelactone hydrolase family protein [Alphaproteobacteria bacterium]